MKSIIKISNALILLMVLFNYSCSKDSLSTITCLVSSASLLDRKIDISYDISGRPTEIRDTPDTSSGDFMQVKLVYNHAGMLDYVRIYDKLGITDSLYFENISSSKIIEHQYIWNGVKMSENYERTFILNSKGYLISDTLYARYSDASELILLNFSDYIYDAQWNVTNLLNYYRYNNANTLDYLVSYEYSDILIPNKSFSFVRYGCFGGKNGLYRYFFPNSSHLLAKEEYSSSVEGNYSIIHSFEVNDKNYPLKENISRSQYTFSSNYSYQCD